MTEPLICSVATIEAIVRLATKYPVFPCRRHPLERPGQQPLKAKSPLTQHGLFDATQDAEQIRAWWQRWPDALVGVPTGATTGLVVVDYDPLKIDATASEWVQDNVASLMSTRSHGTLSGGKHYLFRRPRDYVYRNGVCLTLRGARRNGIDLRADGGYIIWWPLHGGSASGEIAPLPAGLVDEYRVEARDLEPLPAASPAKWQRDRSLVLDALAYVSPADRGAWIETGMALHLASGGSDDGFGIWHAWSAGEITGDVPGAYMGINDCRYHWASFRHDKGREGMVTLGTVFKRASDAGYAYPKAEPLHVEHEAPPDAEQPDCPGGSETVDLNDFRAFMPDHRFVFMPTRDLWPASSVDARIPWPTGANGKPERPSKWLDQNRPVEQMLWAPGEPALIPGRLMDSGGWLEQPSCTALNLYRPPTITPGDPTKAQPWLDHVACVYPNEHEHIIRWLAQRAQHPGVKINHALVLGGKHGIGKDTILEPAKYAVGAWNFVEVSPSAMLGRFNGFVKSVILRISEARDLGEFDRFAFYDHTKTLIAAPPDVLRCDEKHLREHSVLNVCGVIITTNHKSDGIYLPADDRRHFVAWSECDKDDFTPDYWQRLWSWYVSGGTANVVAYLRALDLSKFDCKAPPPKTEAFWHIVNAARTSEEVELVDVLDSLGDPNAITIESLLSQARTRQPSFADWLQDRRNRRQIPHRLESAGYEPIRNDASKDGLWAINDRRQVVYAKCSLSVRDRMAAAYKISRE